MEDRESIVKREVNTLAAMINNLNNEFFPDNEDAASREAERVGLEPFIYADRAGKRCYNCVSTFKDCSLKMRQGGPTCCARCNYTDTHQTQSVGSLLNNRLASPDGILVQKAVKALDVARDLLQSVKSTTPEEKLEAALKQYREVEDKDQLAAEAQANLVDAVEDFLKSREAE